MLKVKIKVDQSNSFSWPTLIFYERSAWRYKLVAIAFKQMNMIETNLSRNVWLWDWSARFSVAINKSWLSRNP